VPAADAPTILIAEDDPNIAALVARYLEREGFRTLTARDGAEALSLVRRDPALVVLDLMLPEVDGWEVCRAVRRESDVPIVMLTAREDEVDRVAGLSMGADDYVVKPFSPRELVERVKAVLRRARRAGPGGPAPGRVLTHGALTLDPERHEVTVDGRPVELTPSEFTLLYTLMRAPGRVFSRPELLDRLHGAYGVVVDRVVDVHIGKLRKKIEADPAAPRHVLTVRGVGYRLADREGPHGEGAPD
jgi:DNA-binding response OmpR family regulator